MEAGKLTFYEFIERQEEPLAPEIKEKILKVLKRVEKLGGEAIDQICFSTWMWAHLITSFSPAPLNPHSKDTSNHLWW